MSLMTVLRGKGLRCRTFRRKAFMPFAHEVCLPVPAVFPQDGRQRDPWFFDDKNQGFFDDISRDKLSRVPSKPHS
ncbi:hypothetical protein [Paenibacillus cookii]|uniref:hypothetical protein n=1 Tax=Paenibacillus cookii TaxID=157839 RepID=UPI001BB3DA62|nr:hypothetical protein [Paenibacillus cookii]